MLQVIEFGIFSRFLECVDRTMAEIAHTVDMKKVIGTEGGSQGSGNPLTHLLVVVDKITGEIVTSYPVKYP